jgi:hypothetical protein
MLLGVRNIKKAADQCTSIDAVREGHVRAWLENRAMREEEMA